MFRYSTFQKILFPQTFSQKTTGICAPAKWEGKTNEHNPGKIKSRDWRSKGEPQDNSEGRR